ncbi:hypothetical protein BH11ACT4_BH11ACT4_20790 [soil metagenome]
MDQVAVITFWQLAGVILPVLGAIALASFLIWCGIGFALWATGSAQRGSGPDTDPEWFETL